MKISRQKWNKERPEAMKALSKAKTGLILSGVVVGFAAKNFLKSLQKHAATKAQIEQVDYMFDKFDDEERKESDD